MKAIDHRPAKSLVQHLLELSSRLELIQTQMNACIAGQKRIKDIIG